MTFEEEVRLAKRHQPPPPAKFHVGQVLKSIKLGWFMVVQAHRFRDNKHEYNPYENVDHWLPESDFRALIESEYK